MDSRPRTDDRFRIRSLGRWYAVCWVALGLCPPLVAVSDRGDATTVWTWALIIVLAVAFWLSRVPSRKPLVRPDAFLCLLVVMLGATAVPLEGGAAFYIVSLPMFWMHTAGPRRAVGYTVAGAVAALAGSLPGGQFVSGNTVFTLIGLTGGVLLGLWAHRLIQQGEERARLLNAELASAQAELAAAQQRQGAAEERERMAREIHDTLAQGFASIIALAEAARTGIDADPARSARQLLSIERTARENLTEARILVGSAAPDSDAIAVTLRRVLDSFSEDTGLTVHAELPNIAATQPIRIALLRCAQESLANVRKHAAATTVTIVLARSMSDIELELTDDGRGFRPDAARGFGLDGMRTRLTELGGALTVTSAPGEGTRVFATLPLDRSEMPWPSAHFG